MKKLVVLLMSLLPISLFAQWNSDNSFMDLSTSGEMPLLKVKSVLTSDGNTWIAYTTYTSGFMVDCKIQLLDNNGYPVFDKEGLSVISNSRDLPSQADTFGFTCDEEGNAIVCFPSAFGLPSYMPLPRVFKIDSEGNQLWGENGIELPVSSDMITSCDLYNLNGNIYPTWSFTDYSSQTSTTNIIELNSDGTFNWDNPVVVSGKNASFVATEEGLNAYWVENNKAISQTFNQNGQSTSDPIIISEDGFYVNEPWSGSPFSLATTLNNDFALVFTGYDSEGKNAMCYAKAENNILHFSKITSDYSFDNIYVSLDETTNNLVILWNTYDYSAGSEIHMLLQNGNETIENILVQSDNSLYPMYATFNSKKEIFCIWAEAEGWSGSNIKCSCYNYQGEQTVITDLFFTSSELNASSFECNDTDAFLYMPYTDANTYESELIGMRIPLNGIFGTTGVEVYPDVTSVENKIYFSIDGKQVNSNSLVPGLYIEYSSKGSRKIYIKN